MNPAGMVLESSFSSADSHSGFTCDKGWCLANFNSLAHVEDISILKLTHRIGPSDVFDRNLAVVAPGDVLVPHGLKLVLSGHDVALPHHQKPTSAISDWLKMQPQLQLSPGSK